MIGTTKDIIPDEKNAKYYKKVVEKHLFSAIFKIRFEALSLDTDHLFFSLNSAIFYATY